MNNKWFSIVLATVLLLLVGSLNTNAQSPAADGHKFEVGAQFSVLNNSVISEASSASVVCVRAPCPALVSFSKSRQVQTGFGGRIGYNLTDNLALEGELNFFPKANLFGQSNAFSDGNLIQGLFGLKAGKRFEKVGVFGKARPGFLYATKGDLQNKPGGCVTVLPPPIGCFEATSKNSLAFDLGGVVELYPTKRTLVRLDFGDTIVRLGQRNVAALVGSPLSAPTLGVIGVPAETTHNLQVSAGIGFRF